MKVAETLQALYLTPVCLLSLSWVGLAYGCWVTTREVR